MAPETDIPHRRSTQPSQDRQRVGPRPQPSETVTSQSIGVVRFIHSLLHLSRARIELQAAGLRAGRTSPDDDVAWWQATVALDRALHGRDPWHKAAMAAHLASQAVLAAAGRNGLAMGPDVTAVARSAGEMARVLAAGDLNTTGAGYLAHGWEDLLKSAAEPHAPPAPAGGRRHRNPRAAANQTVKGRRT
jgi:hypothetical protein